MNYAIYTGRITNDLQLGQTQDGRSYLSFSLAVQRDFKNRNGEYDTDFIPCIASASTAEFIQKQAQKGAFVCISGRMQNNKYTRQDGTVNNGMQLIVGQVDAQTIFAANHNNNNGGYSQNANNVPKQQNGWQQHQQQQQGQNAFANAPIDISDSDLPF